MSLQNLRNLTEFYETNGIGKVCRKDGCYVDVEVYGYIVFNRWAFIVHRDLVEPKYFTVSEASTGRILQDEAYYTIEDAVHFALQFCERKKYNFATTIGNILVETQTNLRTLNTTGLRTLAINTALWL